MSDMRILNPTMLRLMRQLARGRVLGSDGDWCYLYDVDLSQPTFNEQYRRVRLVSDTIATRLILGGYVTSGGVLTDLGCDALTALGYAP